MTTYLKQYARQFRPNIALAAPVMFGQAANVFVGLVDNYMVARLGGDEGQTALAARRCRQCGFYPDTAPGHRDLVRNDPADLVFLRGKG